MAIQPFEVSIPQPTLDDLRERLLATRLAGDASDWDAGTSPAYLRQLVDYWRTQYDWRRHEAELNRFAHFRAPIDGTTIHFIHERAEGDALPLVLTHGFPDSFLRFQKLIPLLAHPADHGADPSDAFHVVAPSLPGYAFSEPLGKAGVFHVGDLWHQLMAELGYRRFGAHGGDWGSTISEHVARSHASSVVGIHVTDVPFWHAFQRPADLAPEEEEYFAVHQDYLMKHGAYAMIQGTRPQTLADGLNDSPAGLAAWLVDFFQRMSDCDGDVETRFSKDELLTNVTLYWATETIGSSFLPYYQLSHAGAARWIVEKAKEWVGSAKVPAGFALFPREISHPPRRWAERFFHVQRWTPMPSGGHFAALEEPELLARDLRDFFRPLRHQN